ncbi:hypothetical protein [Priestia endophytica]|jgi:hypothetical protein|uniref:hypothetical protein n=1 Tax=Priestia endophytica TaxID=135735 RepID=UPI000F52C846|nr:hypothetical protein [Priestia endophytica]RPK10764.1 hypothetical protein FH5_03842 [Priestia endophytica]
MLFKDFAEFKNVLLKKRSAGKVTCSMAKRSQRSIFEDINDFAEELGFQEVEASLNLIDKQIARKIITYVLSMDLAYDSDLDSKPIARDLCNYFVSLFSSKAKYYTNAEFDEEWGYFKMAGWSPISLSTFDTGIIIVDQDNVGVLWVEDED